MFPDFRCHQCRGLEEAHDDAMEQYIRTVNQQVALFRKGQGRAARDLDGEIQRLKTQRQATVDALLRHQSKHLLQEVIPE